MLLTAAVFIPLLGAIVVMLLPRDNKQLTRWVATLFTVGPVLIALYMLGSWNATAAGFSADGKALGWAANLKFVEFHPWISTAGVNYAMGVDAFAFLMLALAALLFLVSAIASWSPIQDRVREYFALFLLLEVGTLGVFTSVDFVLFYVFWEIVLLPMYFLIGIWGGARREYAAIKFFLYTLIGSVFMLVAALGIYFYTAQATGIYTLNIIELSSLTAQAVGKTITPQAALWLFVGLWVGFAVKVPVWPFHTWLPDAHVEAPTPISMLLAGILLKLGTYAMIRVSYPMLPGAAKQFAPVMLALGLIGIVYAALAAMAQKDFKKMVAYSSVNHMGYFLIGMAAGTPTAIAGGFFVTISHGLISAMFFFVVGMFYERMHTRDLTRFGGMFLTIPVIATLTAFTAFANLGLPGLAGFVGEFFALAGTFQTWGFYVLIATFGLVIVAAFHLLLMRQTLLGNALPEWSHGEHKLKDITAREWFVFTPLALLTVFLGIYPGPLLTMIDGSVRALSKLLGGA